MKKFKFWARVLALVLTLIMVASLLPLSTLAAVNDIGTGTKMGQTGVVNSTLGDEGAINWPVKVYDYLADGMLFEYASANHTTIYDESYSESGGGLYSGGEMMPITKLGSDYTADWVYNSYTNNYGGYNPSNNFRKTPTAAVANKTPKYMRLKYVSDSGYANYCVADFCNDWGLYANKNDVRYMVLVYRSSGITRMGLNSNIGSTSGWKQAYVADFKNSTEWTYQVIDLATAYNAYGGSTSWDNITSTIWKMYVRPTMPTSGYLDLSHVAFFSNTFEANQYGKDAVAFDKNPGTRPTSTTTKSTSYGTNGGNNLGFGMLLPSAGGGWSTGGGDSTNASTGYHTYRVGYSPYTTGTGTYSATYNSNRKDINGNLIGADNQIYFVTSTYASNSAFGYQDKLKNDADPDNDADYENGYNTTDLDLDGYDLITHVTQGLMSIGLLEGTLENGKPVYREEAVEYVAEMLYKTLVIPQKDANGKANYNFVNGVDNGEQYGTDPATGKDLDLAQALRNCLGITFSSGLNKGYFPASTSTRTYGLGSYEGTLTRANNETGLIGDFLDVKDNIHTCMDAAYYLLNNIFIENSYNQLQDDFHYLTLSKATLTSGGDAYVFDAGFANGADPTKIGSTYTQDSYKAASQSAVEYRSTHTGGDGHIALGPVQAKDMYYYDTYSTTTRFPFLPVVDAEGVYAGETKSVYFLEDGYRSYTKDFGTYVDRNFNYVLESNGQFVYNEEDDLFFEFEGDDDVYLFINGHLVLDIGGAHSISNVNLKVNDYVEWAENVLDNPDNYSQEEIARAEALNLEDGEIASFDFYYMERHGFGANMRIVTNMRITDPKLGVDKTAYQGKEIEYGGVVEPEKPIEYNFALTNSGNTKLYNLEFDDKDIGVRLNSTEGLFISGEDTPDDINDDKNGVYVTDARGETLEAKDLTAIVTGYKPVDSGGTLKKVGKEYVTVTDGSGTHEYVSITQNFSNEDELKGFMKTLEGDGLDKDTVDEELTQKGSGLWVDATVTIKGIYYLLEDKHKTTGVFDNTVKVSATTRSKTDDPASKTLTSQDSHRVYLTAIPSYYQWADHNVFVSAEKILKDAAGEASNTGSLLHTYIEFFTTVKEDITKVTTTMTDRFGKPTSYNFVKEATDGSGTKGYDMCYPEQGIYEYFLTMKLNAVANTDISKLTLGQYAIIRVLVIVTDANDAEYVLDYGLKTEQLDSFGELFKGDELLGDYSGTQAKILGINSTGGTYLNYKDGTSDYNRIDFKAQDLEESNKIDVYGNDGNKDGFFTFNLAIPDTGREIYFDAPSRTYALTETGTSVVHVKTPASWSLNYEDIFLYYWYDGGVSNGWPGKPMEKVSNGNYKFSIPATAPHVIIHNGVDQTQDLDINAGQEVWITLDGYKNDEGNLNAAISYAATDGVIHIDVPDNWGDEVWVHLWDDFDNPIAEWPGIQVTEKDDDGRWTINIPGDLSNIIVNNGANGKQTDDLKIFAGKETWITVADEPYSYNDDQSNAYYHGVATRTLDTVTMYAQVPEDWNTAYFYYWNSNGAYTGIPDFPGIEMTKGDDGWYSLEVPGDVTNCIISNGTTSKQTEDLLLENVGADTWITVKSPEAVEMKTNATVEAAVPADWTNVYFYFFNAGGTVGTDWPGVQVTANDAGKYVMEVPYGATNVIVNNNNGSQTPDLGLRYDIVNKYTVHGANNVTPESTTTLRVQVPSDWGNVCIHYWNDNGSIGTQWPGIQNIQKDSEGWYTIEVPKEANEFIINNNNGRQTGDTEMKHRGGENRVIVGSDNGVSQSTFTPAGVTTGKYKASFAYGAEGEGIGFTFTPVDFMDTEYNMYLALSVHESDHVMAKLGEKVEIGKEVQMFKKVTVLPANVVYYEDDFAGVKYTTEGTKNVYNHYGDGSGSLTQGVSQSQNYGNDGTYQTSGNDEVTGGSLSDVYINDTNSFAEFTFTGTGFEIIGHTHAVGSGTLIASIYDEAGNLVKEVPVITEFDQGADGGENDTIKAIPIIRVSDLEHGTYTVKLSGVPVYDFSNFDPSQIGPNGERPELPTLESYVCIDGVRIFQPLKDNQSAGIYGNVALGKDYQVSNPTSGSWTASLNDGVAPSELWVNNTSGGWFGFNTTNTDTAGNGYITFDLGVMHKLDKFRIHLFANDLEGASIGHPSYIDIGVSKDGKNYTFAGSPVLAPSTSGKAYWATLEKDIEGRYVRIAIGKDPNYKAWIFLNEIEIYGDEIIGDQVGANDAYLDGENAATFTEVRKLISERKAFAIKYDDTEGLSVSGGTNTFIENRNNLLPSDFNVAWLNKNVNSINDYMIAGPNNEVYMVETTDDLKTGLAFYVTEGEYSDTHEMQIGFRGMDHNAYMGASTSGKVNAELQYGVIDREGNLLWKTLTTSTSTAEQYIKIPYNECPYDADNNRYQVVLRVADTDVTGMASFTTLKYKGLELNVLNESEVPDVIYDDELNNDIIDSNGNSLDTSKFVSFIDLVDQMKSDSEAGDGGTTTPEPEPVQEGVNTSELGKLADSFTKNLETNFELKDTARIYIVSATQPSAKIASTAELIQSQFAADGYEMDVVWGEEKYAKDGDLIYKNNTAMDAEGYNVLVNDKHATVSSADVNGMLYGFNTLQKHFRYAADYVETSAATGLVKNVIKGFSCTDAPDTKERTIHLDCARKYLTKEFIINYIREMSWMGYNAIELHFSEDGGFRADFWDPAVFTSPNGNDFSWISGSKPAYWVTVSDPDQGKYLTAAEMKEICETAVKYNMEVIPSFDTPAHVDYLTYRYYNDVQKTTAVTNFKYDGKTYVLPSYIHYRPNSTYDSRWAVLNLGDSNVQAFAFALYEDIAAFFKQYAGSTKFNVGGDEVGLTSTDFWNYADFYNYVNKLNSLLNEYGYTTRIYNDFLGRQEYIDMLPSGTTMPSLASNIEIVYWTADGDVQPASYFVNQNRKIYGGMNYWTYYVFRYADRGVSSTNANYKKDARDPSNTWWSFYRNQEDYVYAEWTPALSSKYGATTAYNVPAANLNGGYFMVWLDYAGINTEGEMWAGVWDKSGSANNGKYFYSLRERMWSNAIKQWNTDINSSVNFATYEGIRDTHGDYPGYDLAGNNNSPAVAVTKPAVLPEGSSLTGPMLAEYTVTFKDYDNKVIKTEVVMEGQSATAPADPVRLPDVYYNYTFTGWDTDFTNVKSDLVVKATYSEEAILDVVLGNMEIKVSGGSNFKMTVDDSSVRDMGSEFITKTMPVGAKVTVTAETTDGNEFVHWISGVDGTVLSTDEEYTFFTTGGDVLLAVYETAIENMHTVTFKNNKNNQILDMQYYKSTDTIKFPSDISYPGYVFKGWDHTEAQIQEKLAQGKNVTVLPIWEIEKTYVSITVNSGTVTEHAGKDTSGKYLAYKGTVVTADKAPSGMEFAYWVNENGRIVSYDKVYKFYPTKDMTLTAKYRPVGMITVAEITGVKELGTSTDTPSKTTFTVYFTNNWNWSDVRIYYWGVDGAPSWAGLAMTLLDDNGTADAWDDLYVYEVPVGVTGMIINGLKDDGSGNRDQSPDITEFVDGRRYEMTWDNGNKVVVDDSRVNKTEETLKSYIHVSEEWTQDNAWFAANVWADDNTDETFWYKLEHVSGNIYVVETPVKYNHMKIVRLNPAYDEPGWNTDTITDRVWHETPGLLMSPTDPDNMYVFNPGFDGGGTAGNMYTTFFVNDRKWDTVKAYYTDATGTHEAKVTLVETDELGNDVYSILVPNNATCVTLSDGTAKYDCTITDGVVDRTIFQVVDKLVVPEYKVIAEIDVDTITFGDRNTVFFSWSVPTGSEYTFVNAGVLLVENSKYVESSFVLGGNTANTLTFVPSQKYQTATGTHSVTQLGIKKGDVWKVRGFVQYRDKDGILRVAYSDIVTATKE